MKRLLFLLLWALPTVAHAEVMDKMPLPLTNGLGGLVGIVVAYLCARFKPRILIVVLPVACVWFGPMAAETLDLCIGHAISAEAGPIYVASPWVALAGIFVSVAIGLWHRRRPLNTSFNSEAQKRAD